MAQQLFLTTGSPDLRKGSEEPRTLLSSVCGRAQGHRSRSQGSILQGEVSKEFCRQGFVEFSTYLL